MIAAVVTALLAHWVDTGVIIGVVIVNAFIGFIQEGKAEKALDAVRSMLSPKALVLRDGIRRTIPAAELVAGDVVVLTPGDRVPADLRIIRVRELRVDEALLTGESVPVAKHPDPVAEDAVIGDRSCLAFSGTLVTYGQGQGVVVATGIRTELGRSVQTLTTPLLRQLAVFGRWLTGAILAVASATFMFGVLLRHYGAGDMFLAAVGLSVAAIPEGLPAIITITLAIGVQRMSRRNAIIRRLPAVEALGSVTVVCSDKTGTLTRNEMTVVNVLTAQDDIEVLGVGYDPHGDFELSGRSLQSEEHSELQEACRVAMLCNDASAHFRDAAWQFEGDPTEVALLVLAIKAGLDPELLAEEYPRGDVIPFESEHRLMATLHHDHAGHGFVFVKGAPEAILTRCSHQFRSGSQVPLDSVAWHARAEQVAARGRRMLALAIGDAPAERGELNFADIEEGLTMLALVGIIDPPRDEAIVSVAQCRQAGIRVKMITGDHAVTASAIAARMAIGDGSPALTGSELEQASDAELRAMVKTTDVFARASPEHKLRLVEALQANGAVVSMTGDGVNDAPALKRADIGVAMGVKGTEAAKEAAEMVLVDDNFASIASAIEEGRTVYDNIRKSILFILPTNGGEALTLIAAILFGTQLPVTPAQILWVNMITAVPHRRGDSVGLHGLAHPAGGDGDGGGHVRALRLGTSGGGLGRDGAHRRGQYAGGVRDLLPLEQPLHARPSAESRGPVRQPLRAVGDRPGALFPAAVHLHSADAVPVPYRVARRRSLAAHLRRRRERAVDRRAREMASARPLCEARSPGRGRLRRTTQAPSPTRRHQVPCPMTRLSRATVPCFSPFRNRPRCPTPRKRAC
jgi:magnesium-transporting ATPase (P-type)